MKASYWLVKTEPHTFSFEQLLREGKTNWNGVRNFQARNFLRQMKTQDQVLVYHSGDEKSVVGRAQVIREAYPDIDERKPGDWVQVDLQVIEGFRRKVSLSEMKKTPSLSDLLLIKQSRLSVMPITPQQFETLLSLGDAS
ncbi:MAG: EVE domain-containing protein [Bdellovibrionia bacterium]